MNEAKLREDVEAIAGTDWDWSTDIDAVVNIVKKYLPQWQPIETAPKDGSEIIVYRPNHDGTYIPKVGVDFWMKGLEVWGKSRSDTQPTHWQPIPEPPNEA